MRYGIKNNTIYAAAMLVLAIPGLLGGARPARADALPTPAKTGQTWTRLKDGAAMVAVPAGEFMESSKPQRRVTLDGYWIDKNLVTVAQYKKFCGDTGRKMPSIPPWGWKDDHPMVNVTWNDAKAYADWAGASLPTEAQWEKAARGTDGRKYPWGNDWDTSKLWSSVDGEKHGTAPVGSFPKGASPYGALDMTGNVWEWCADWYGDDYYENAPARNPVGPATGDCRVLRGGCWYYVVEYGFRCAYRLDYEPPNRLTLGFRCALRAAG